MIDHIQYHEGILAINVKDHHNYRIDHRFTNFSDDEIQIAYDDVTHMFWNHYAPETAARYGYGQVFSEGRSGGWLIVENEPCILDEDDEPLKQPELDNWLEFQKEIYEEMDFCCNELLLSMLNENKTNEIQEEHERQHCAARDIITI